MKICGIIAEYNPFHNGHFHHISQAKRAGCDIIIIAMSGSFVQRGEFAVYDKWMRAKWALSAGADAVLELPTVHVLQSAQYFAQGGVKLLSAANCTHLSFGSESLDTQSLKSAANMINSQDEELTKALRENLDAGMSYASSMGEASKSARMPDVSTAMRSPNFLLGAHYCAAIEKYAPHMEIVPIKRVGAGYNDTAINSDFASATAIRNALFNNSLEKIYESVPSFVAYDMQTFAPANFSAFESAFLYALRSSNTDELADICGMVEGLENAFRSASNLSSYEEIISAVKSKRYTMARIKRLCCAIYLHMSASFAKKAPDSNTTSARVLGWKRGREDVLKEMSAKGLNLIISKSDLARSDDLSKQIDQLDCLSADLHALSFPDSLRRKGSRAFSQLPLIV